MKKEEKEALIFEALQEYEKQIGNKGIKAFISKIFRIIFYMMFGVFIFLTIIIYFALKNC